MNLLFATEYEKVFGQFGLRSRILGSHAGDYEGF
jgi:hypothetical protein